MTCSSNFLFITGSLADICAARVVSEPFPSHGPYHTALRAKLQAWMTFHLSDHAFESPGCLRA